MSIGALMPNRAASRADPSTLANLAAFDYKHLSLDLNVDFEGRTLSGTATWTLVIADAAATELVLDTSSGLMVREAKVNGVGVAHSFAAAHAALGTALCVPLPEAVCGEAGRELTVELAYSTSPESQALQWLRALPVRRRALRQVHIQRHGTRACMGNRLDERGAYQQQVGHRVDEDIHFRAERASAFLLSDGRCWAATRNRCWPTLHRVVGALCGRGGSMGVC